MIFIVRVSESERLSYSHKIFINVKIFDSMKLEDTSRQKIAAEQIEAAMKERGLGKKQFAVLMHKNPSEVTKWLSGNHNFTIALLEDISRALGVRITGVEDVSGLVYGYTTDTDELHLEDSVAAYSLDRSLTRKIRRRSAELGISAKRYLELVVDEEISKSIALPKVSLPSIYDDVVQKYASIASCPSMEDLNKDERLARIWNR